MIKPNNEQLRTLNSQFKLLILVSLTFILFCNIQSFNFLGSTISLDPFRTKVQSSWILCLWFIFTILLLTPKEEFKLPIGKTKKDENYLLESSRTINKNSYLIFNIIIFLGVCFSFISVIHLIFANEVYFGIFKAYQKNLHDHRAHWPFVNPNHLSIFLEMAIILALVKLLHLVKLYQLQYRGKPYLKNSKVLFRFIFNGLILFTLLIAQLLTFSRAGISLTFLGIVVILFFFNKTNTEKDKSILLKITKCILIVCSLVFFIFIIGKTGRETLTERIEFGLASGYDSIRKELAIASVEIFKDYPLFGVGLGNWELIAPKKASNKLFGFKLDYAHNDYLQVLAETGVIGFTLLLTLVITFFVSFYIRWKSKLDPARRILLLGSFISLVLPLLHANVSFPFHMPGLCLSMLILLVSHLLLVPAEQNGT